MKEWIRPELEQLEISETMYGGSPTDTFDIIWEGDDGKLNFEHGTMFS